MNCIARSASPLLTVLLTSLWAVLFTTAATAQVCGVRNSYRISNSHSGTGSELIVDTGWVGTAPLTTPGSNNNTTATCSSQGSCIPFADYGYLHCDGAGTATNCPTSGVFLWLDGGPQARFRDTMTATSSTLPNGTPVQVQIVLSMIGTAQVFDPTPYVDFRAALNAASLSIQVANGPGTVVGTLTTYVGSSVLLQADLSATLYAYGLMGLGNPPLSSAYALDLTARVGATSLTPGATLQFCSGHDYTPLASVSPIGGGCGSTSPMMAATVPLLGQNQNYGVTSAPTNQPVFFAYSLGNPFSVPIGGCLITEDPNEAALLFVGVSNAVGICNFSLSIPSSSSLSGVSLTAQALVLSPGGPLLGFAELSNGVLSTLGA